MSTQIWQNANLKKGHNRISVTITVIMRFGFEIYKTKKKKNVAGENVWLVH